MPDLRFPRSNRLLKSAEFQPLFDKPDFRISNGPFLLLARRRPPNADPRIGLVTGKRRVRRAVDRNRIRRLTRESFRLRKAALPPLDIVILVRGTLQNPDRTTTASQLDSLWTGLLAKAQQD